MRHLAHALGLVALATLCIASMGFAADAPSLSGLKLEHRWSFNGTLEDSVGRRTATIVNVGPNDAILGTSSLRVMGGPRTESDYVSLGSLLLAGRTNAMTLELWASQLAVRNWGRIFDFGHDEEANFFMSWCQQRDSRLDRVEWRMGSSHAKHDNSNAPYKTGVEYHIAMVIEPLAGTSAATRITWYSAPADDATLGPARGIQETRHRLQDLDDREDNLARSFYAKDETATARYNEVRIWQGAAGATALQKLHQAGPDATFP